LRFTYGLKQGEQLVTDTPNCTDLQNLLVTALNNRPEKIALRVDDRQISYAELDRLVGAVSAGLQRSGIAPGERVAWLLPNSLEAVLTTLACWRIGAIVVPLNYRYVAEEALDVLQRTSARLLVFHASREAVALPYLEAHPATLAFEVSSQVSSARQSFVELLDHGVVTQAVPMTPESPALILFTSGSTGHPKGVVHSHFSAFQGIDISRQIFDFNNNDVVLVGKPISHAGGLQTQMMPTFLVGGEVVLAVKPSPEDAVRLINEYSVTEYGMLASDLLDFVEYLEAHSQSLPTLRNGIGSGDSVPTDLHHRFRDLLGWEVMEGSGMTEINGYYSANPRYGKRKWGSIGLPSPGGELRLVDDSGRDCGAEVVGEIMVKIASATIGYWQDEKATAALFENGWLHSGDLARFDDEGYFWFVGRKKLMIIRRGSNIAPAEVENVIDEHPAVHASVVVGVRDRRDGQVPVACVALIDAGNSAAEQELPRYVSEHLAEYKCPVQYLFLPELPRTGTGKFDRQELHELAKSRFGA
jgi:long-chain acyl-CoA synthetase